MKIDMSSNYVTMPQMISGDRGWDRSEVCMEGGRLYWLSAPCHPASLQLFLIKTHI